MPGFEGRPLPAFRTSSDFCNFPRADARDYRFQSLTLSVFRPSPYSRPISLMFGLDPIAAGG